MSKILLPQLITMLASSSGKSKKQAEAFLKAFFNTISEGLAAHDSIKIKGIGTFKVTRIEARKSKDVSTGEDVQIPPHFRVNFKPADTLAAKVNKEFAWLEVIELSENLSNTEIDDLKVKREESGQVVSDKKEPILEKKEEEPLKVEDPIVEIEGNLLNDEEYEPNAASSMQTKNSGVDLPDASWSVTINDELTEKEEQQSEKLGEELEEEFGVPEPTEPFGPIDPQDPEPGEPIPEESIQQEVLPSDVIEAEERLPDFDPYAVVQEKGAMYPLTQNSEVSSPINMENAHSANLDNFATKEDIKIVKRNIKKLRRTIDENDLNNAKRSRNILIWSVVISLLIMVGCFFIFYYILTTKFIKQEPAAVEKVETPSSQIDQDDEEYAPTTVNGISSAVTVSSPVSENNKGTQKNIATTPETAAPTTPSDIKAMDKITKTRYLTSMAKDYYGNFNFWPYIYMENEAKLGHPHPDRIKPGTSVVIPDITLKYDIDTTNPKEIEKAKKLATDIYHRFASK